MNSNLTKGQRRRLRELGGIAYERDLSRELTKLEGEFGRWRAGGIDAFELSDAIHRFHQGPSRSLFSRYDPSNLDLAVALAIHRGVLSPEEVGVEIIELLKVHLTFLRERDAADSALPRSADSRARR